MKLKRKKSTTTDIDSLVEAAKKLGLDKEINKLVDRTPKISTFQRLSAGFGAFNTAEAVLTGLEKDSFGAGVRKYASNVYRGIQTAITGKDTLGQKRYYADVAKEAGIENNVARFGVGLVGDILLSPDTYFGGALAKGILKATKIGGGLGLKAVAKVSPELGGAIKISTEAFQDAFGAAFKAGYKTTKGMTDFVMGKLGKAAAAKAGLAESNLTRLGTGILTKEQNKEVFLRMAGGKRLEFALREAGESAAVAGEKALASSIRGATGAVKETIESQAKRVARFGEDIVGDEFYRSYFPFIKKDKLTRFVNETKALRVGSQGYLKQFKNLLTNENLEQDVAKAFFTRESQIVTDKITQNTLKGIVKNYGKPLNAFKNEAEAIQNGFSLLREKGIFGKELGWVSKWDKKFITDMFSPEFKTVDMLAKATGFDALTSLFKRSVTGLFAPFHIRNYLSGVIQNYEVLGAGALKPSNIAAGQKLALNTIKGVKMKGKIAEQLKPFAERFAYSSFFTNEFDDALRMGQTLDQYRKILSAERLGKTVKTLGLSAESIPFKTGRAVGNYIELQQKAVAYVTALGQGKTIKQALGLAEAAGFDYRMLTRFESQILRRIVPFYSFTRKNIELQLKTLGANPQRINQIMRLAGNTSELFGAGEITEEEKAGLPDYIKEGFAIKLPDSAEGLKQYLSDLGTPVEQFAKLFKPNTLLNIISMTNPILKTPIELSIGKDSFRQKDLKEVYDAREYSFLPESVRSALGIREIEKPIYKKVGDKLKKVGTRKQYIADPEKLLIMRSMFTSRGVSYLDQIFDGDMVGMIKYMKLFTGIKPQQIDTEVTKALKDKETKRALEDLLIKMGEYRRYESIYKPKQ